MVSKKLTPKGKSAVLNDGGESEVRHPYKFRTSDGQIIGASSSRIDNLQRSKRYDLEDQIDRDMGLDPEDRSAKYARKALSVAANILSPATRVLATAAEPLTNPRKYERHRFLEKKSAEQHYDNSKTDVRVGIDYRLLLSGISIESLEDFILKRDQELFLKIKNEGRDSLTDEEIHEKTGSLFDALSEDPGMRMDFINWCDKEKKFEGSKKVDGTSLPSFGPVECEFFGPGSAEATLFSRNQTDDASLRGFDPTVRGAARQGVVLENSIENNKILIRNICKPPESLNCTIRLPRVDEKGKKLPMRDRKGNLIEGNFDMVVIRKGKPAMVVNGEKGESRIANMADMLGQLDKPISGMEAAKSRGSSVSGMEAAKNQERSTSGMKATGDSFRAPTGVFTSSMSASASSSGVKPDTTPSSGMKASTKGRSIK